MLLARCILDEGSVELSSRRQSIDDFAARGRRGMRVRHLVVLRQLNIREVGDVVRLLERR
jgi:hypothetical protein